MSTKTYLEMVTEAIPLIRDRKGASRAAIAAWIQANCSKEAGAMFNARLRTALNKGLEQGVLKEGNTAQRFRIGVLPKAAKPKKKKVASKKKKTPKKKAKKAALKKAPAAQAAQAREDNKRLYFKMLELSGSELPAEKTKPEEKT